MIGRYDIFNHYSETSVYYSILNARNTGNTDPYWDDLEIRAKEYFGENYGR